MNRVPTGLLDQQFAANLRGEFDEGWRIAQILEKRDPADNRAAYNRGWHHLRAGDLQEGMRCLDRGRSEEVFGSRPPQTDKPQWRGEDVTGKTVLLFGEGGLGDEMINVRFAKSIAARGARVILACSDGLISLFRRVEGVADVVPLSVVPHVPFDLWTPAMSVPIPLGITYDTLPNAPYLSANAAHAQSWKKRVSGPGLKVGIRWGGNPRYEHQQFRLFPPEPLFELAKLPGVQLYSLQRDNDLRDLPSSIIDLQHEIRTWEDTAAAIANLDLIITSCTAVAHLAAAMGKETWIIVPMLSYYVWALPGDKSPWYPSVQLFRQKTFGVWDETLADVQAAFQKRLGSGSRSNAKMKFPSSPSALPSAVPRPPIAPAAPPSLPGLFFAPKPESREPFRHGTGAKMIHLVAGFPRCGSTALISLLAQNPRIHGAPISGLCGIFSGVYANWEKGDFHKELPNPDAKRRILSALLAEYHATDRPIIVDKDRQWVMRIALLEEILGRSVKVIVPVRPVPEILASFEALRRKHPLEFTNADEAIGDGSTIESRAAYYAGAGGPMGMAYNATKDAVTAGYLDRMLFVDYNKLTAAPKMQLKRIYEFLEEPYFEHDLTHVPQVAQGDWHVHKLPGLHDVRPVFAKEAKSARDLLGEGTFSQYNRPEPWSAWT